MNAIRVRLLDLEADTPSEVAEVIAKALDGKPAPTVERTQRAVLDTLEQVSAPVVREPAEPAPVKVRTVEPPAHTMTTPGELAASLYEAAGVADGPFLEWLDVPEALRTWNTIGTICHVRSDPNDLRSVYCKTDIGMPRSPDLDPRNDARVCAGCNRAIERSKRKDQQ